MIGHTLNRRLDVWRSVRTDDGAGGQTRDRVMVGTVRARISQPRAAERVVAEQAGSEHDHNIYLLPAADVRRGDELLPAGALYGTRPYYRVISVVTPSAPVYRRAEVELVDAEGA
jgi:SPP1 family predicted phage head-tail adaptor